MWRKVKIMELFIFFNVLYNEALQAVLAGEKISAMQKLIAFSETAGVTATPLTELIVSLLANDDNVLSRLAQENKTIGKDLYEFSLADIEKLFAIFQKNDAFAYQNSNNLPAYTDAYCASIRNMTLAETPKSLLDMLIAHYKQLGVGVFAKYIAFKFDGALTGIELIDRSASFDALVGLEHQKKVLLDNTKALIAGSRANNVLLFGDRGTGKSSSIKALLNMFAQDGLRIIEIQKQQIRALPELITRLAPRPHKYIIFLDDLSFEKQDAEYKALKTVMDGQLQPMPQNVVIYATSNRKHLIKENWADRQAGDVHANDNMQETLSLAERFGISLVFSTPNQKEYLHIVSELLRRDGIEMDAEIERKAIVWQMNYGSRSPRCATQFVHAFRKA